MCIVYISNSDKSCRTRRDIFNRVYDRVEGWRAGKACLMASRGRTEDYE